MVEKKPKDFLNPEKLAILLFGEDLRSGAFGKLEERLDNHCEEMNQLKQSINNFQLKFEEYNNLHEKTRRLSQDYKDHVRACQEIQRTKETAQAVADAYAKGLVTAEKKGSDDTKKTIKETVWLIISVLTVLTLATGVISFFLGLWEL